MVASCAGITGYARAASMDMALAAAFTVGMLGWWAWHETGKRVYLAAFFALMALGTLAKGPVAPFLACLVIAVYASAVRDFRVAFKTIWLPGILLFCAIALPWYFAVQMRNPGFFREFIVEHNLGRFSKNLYHHTEPFWYYLPVTALALASLDNVCDCSVRSIAAGVVDCTRTRQAVRKTCRNIDLVFSLCCWLIVPVVFFLDFAIEASWLHSARDSRRSAFAGGLSKTSAWREDDAASGSNLASDSTRIVRVGSNCSRLADCISHHAASSSRRPTDAGRALALHSCFRLELRSPWCASQVCECCASSL